MKFACCCDLSCFHLLQFQPNLAQCFLGEICFNERQLFLSGRGDNYHKKCILGLLLNFFCYNDKFALLPACLLIQGGIASQ